jgi:hypothetical protein
MKPGRAALALATLLVSSRAHAVELSFGARRARVDVTTTTIVSYHLDNDNSDSCDDDYLDVIERLNVGGFMDDWNVGLRLDGSGVAGAPEQGEGDPPCGVNQLRSRYELDLRPEKVWVGWSGRSLEFVAGDAYVSFGRGLSLSLRKVDELGVDTTLRGAKVLLHHDVVDATFVAGLSNIANLDEATGFLADDTNDLIGGLDVQLKPKDGIAIGAHGVVFAFKDPLGFDPDAEDYEEKWILFGPTVDAPRLLPWLGVFVEGVGQRRMPSFGDEEDGFGIYGTITGYAGPTTIVVEGKAYGDLQVVSPIPPTAPPELLPFRSVQYASPPTVERILQIIENPQQEIAGARVRVDHAISPELLLYANYGLFRDYLGYQHPEDPVQGKVDSTIHDPYVGAEIRWDQARSRVLASGGARLVFIDDVSEPVQWDLHGEADVVVALTQDASLELHALHTERRKVTAIATEDWREGTLQLGFRLRPHLAISGVLDYTTEVVQTKDIYPSGVLQWDITDSSSVRLQAGSTRGGLKCVSGVCRVFPPFDGVKLLATFRF